MSSQVAVPRWPAQGGRDEVVSAARPVAPAAGAGGELARKASRSGDREIASATREGAAVAQPAGPAAGVDGEIVLAREVRRGADGVIAPAAEEGGAVARPVVPVAPGGAARMRVARVPEAQVAEVVARVRRRGGEDVVPASEVVDERAVRAQERAMLAALERVQSAPAEVARTVDFDVPEQRSAPEDPEVLDDADDPEERPGAKRPVSSPLADVDLLYDRIAARLRRELMDDHERRGSLRPPW
jgi:hypothetical protein